MPENIIRIDRHMPGARLDRLVTQKVTEILNAIPDASGRRDRRPSMYERSGGWKAYRAGVTGSGSPPKPSGSPVEMEGRRLGAAARCLREGIGEATTYLLPEFPAEHRRRIRTNDMIERLNREIRRRTRVAGGFPDGNSALMLVCACIRYAAANEWSNRRYLDMPRLGGTPEEAN